MVAKPFHIRLVEGLSPADPWDQTQQKDPRTYFERMSVLPQCVAKLRPEPTDAVKPVQKELNYAAKYGALYGPPDELMYPQSVPYDSKKAEVRKGPIRTTAWKTLHGIVQPNVTTDSQQAYFDFDVPIGQTLVTVYDIRLSSGYVWRRPIVDQYGYEQLNRYKMMQLRGGPAGERNGPFITERTFFDHAYAKDRSEGFVGPRRVCELVQTSNSATRMLTGGTPMPYKYIPGKCLSWTENEILYPRLLGPDGKPIEFYMYPDVVARRVCRIEYVCPLPAWTESPITGDQMSKFYDGHVVRISTWYLDENRDAVQTLDRLPMICEYSELVKRQAIEVDTGEDNTRPEYSGGGTNKPPLGTLLHPGDFVTKHFDIRNQMAFAGLDDVTPLLERPAGLVA